MKRYETIFILDPDLEEEVAQSTLEKIKGIVTQFEGSELFKFEDWGPRRLAYEVKKKVRGRYVLIHFAGPPALLSELHRNFRVMDPVIKFQSVRLDERKETSTKPPPPEEPLEEESAPEQA